MLAIVHENSCRSGNSETARAAARVSAPITHSRRLRLHSPFRFGQRASRRFAPANSESTNCVCSSISNRLCSFAPVSMARPAP